MLNVLNLAIQTISGVHPNVTVTCFRYSSSSVDAAGRVSPTFTQFSAVAQFQYQQVTNTQQPEMNVAKVPANVYINAELHTDDVQKIADYILYDGKYYNVVGVNNWNPGNGWGCYQVVLDKTKSGI